MAGIGIGLGVGLGGGEAGWSEAGIARALAARGLNDADARAAIGAAPSLPAGLRAVGLLPPAAANAAPGPAVTPLPAGIAAMWDAASLAGLADGAPVLSWTDGVGGAVAGSSGEGGTPHSFVARSAGGPAVRLNGGDLLRTSGANAAAAAMMGGERTMVVVARNIADAPSGAPFPFLASCGDNRIIFAADTGSTGLFGRMTACADAGMRSIAFCSSAGRQHGGDVFSMDGVNGGAFQCNVGAAGGGQIAIGGWRNASGDLYCGRADILAVIVWNRALTATEFKAVHRHYCDRLGQAYPGGAAARTVSFLGDSLTMGLGVDKPHSWPFTLAAGLALPWGTWDSIAAGGYTWNAIGDIQLPMLGNASALTGTRNIVCVFEWANDIRETGDEGQSEARARAVIDALHAQDANREVVFGTSTDDGSPTQGGNKPRRAAYNAWWNDPSHRTGLAAYVPLHLDPDIGAVGAAPTDGVGNAWYQADGIHNTAAGYGLIDNGPHGFREAVAARLAAA